MAALFLLALTGFLNGRRQHGYQMVCLAFLALTALLLLRILINSLIDARRNILNSKLEKRQLEKARKRRGDFSNRQGYSGKTKISEAPAAEVDKTKAEIEELISKEAQDAENDLTADDSLYYPEENAETDEQIEDIAEHLSDEDSSIQSVFYVKPAVQDNSAAPFAGNSILAADVYETLLKLGELKKTGVITEEEFEMKKAELLDRIK
ncbi:MAG: SHOCT domain-containing protein [Lachnospiraceae bacterium]|nr:SHOCT domain-containing protein [Lachnospiraceae bacterium]